MTSPLHPLFEQASRVTATGSKSFYFATQFFPPELARAAHSVYWFCRYTDDMVDECASVEQGRFELEHWAESVRAGFDGEPVDHPVLRLFLHTAREYNIPSEYAFELIEGMRMDLNGTRYGNFGELRQFCYRVASVVGLMMSHVIGFSEPHLKERGLGYAIDLGIAMQLTNILRDIGEDLERGRVYLPADEMDRFGYTHDDLRNHRRNAAFHHLMRFQIERARRYYTQAQPGIALLHPRGRFAVRVAADVYRQILNRIEANDYQVFTRRAVVPAVQKYWITARSMAVPIARHSVGKMAFWRG